MATLAIELKDKSDGVNLNVVKVFFGEDFKARDFSRRMLTEGSDQGYFKHIGIYAFRKKSLEKFCSLPMSPRERTEKLEQLRALEAGISIGVVLAGKETIAVDTPEDLYRVEKFLAEACGEMK
jgi:3-deoxy-manno-octulosonate cytidylyltransferase (CMP-KDO synthetase)